jgi:nitrite reductase (NADH) small subunit
MSAIPQHDAFDGVHVCAVEDIPLGEGRSVAIEGHRIALFRTRRGWYALDAECPHLRGPLADGIVADRSVICPLHERRFDLASGAPLSGGCGVRAHQVTVVGRQVFVALDTASNDTPP